MITSAPESRRVAALDFDDTCLRGDISESLLRLLDEASPDDLEGAYRRGVQADVRAAYVSLVHTLVAGRTEATARALAHRALVEGAERGLLAVRQSMVDLVAALHRHGWEVWIVTASPEVLVQAAVKRFDIPADRVIGMRSAMGTDGVYLPHLCAPPTMFEGKVDAIVAAAGCAPTFSAGDSTSDLPLLRSARYALLLDKGDPALRSVAERAGWWVQPAESVA